MTIALNGKVQKKLMERNLIYDWLNLLLNHDMVFLTTYFLIIQLKYTIEGVSKIPVPESKSISCSETCFIIPIETINQKKS